MQNRGLPIRLTRRGILGALLSSAAGAALAKAPTSSIRPVPREPWLDPALQRPVEEIIAASGLTGDVAFVVADAETGEVIESHRPLLSLPPASVAKAVTAVYALEALGGEHRFVTRLLATGPVKDGVIQGDLVLEGGGDPDLDTDALGDMVAELKEAGVKGVTGTFKVCAGALPAIPEIDPGQPVEVGYNPAVSGLNLNYNRVHFEWKRDKEDYTVSMDARAAKYSPGVTVSKMRIVDRQGPVYTYADRNGLDIWTVAKPALGQGGSRWLPVRKPDAYAAEVFQTLARSHGIRLPAAKIMEDVPKGETLVQRQSAPLTDILREMLKWSTNLTAEVAGLAATVSRGERPTSLAASAKRMNEWARDALGTTQAAFVDHSGLGEASRINPRDMVMALLMARATGPLPGLMKDIPIRDDDWNVVPNHPVNVRAKTGTLNFVTALAGYMTAADGRDLVFAYFSADLEARAKIDPEDGEIPAGSRAWRATSRALQMQLLERWGAMRAAEVEAG